MNDNIKYFKVRYAFMPTWTLQQAAHLLMGYDPENPAFKVGDKDNNPVSVLFYWLQAQHLSGQLFSTGFAWKEPAKFGAEKLFECMDAGKRDYDEDLYAARQLIWHKKPNVQAGGRVIKIIYRYAAELIWDKQPTLHIPQMAQHLMELAEKFNAKYGTALKSDDAVTIAGFLKGVSPHDSGAPPKGNAMADSVDWHYVIEKM